MLNDMFIGMNWLYGKSFCMYVLFFSCRNYLKFILVLVGIISFLFLSILFIFKVVYNILLS